MSISSGKLTAEARNPMGRLAALVIPIQKVYDLERK